MSNPASPVLVVEGSYIPETFFVSYQQKALNKLNSSSQAEGLNTPWVVSYGYNGLRNIFLVDATNQLFVQKETTDFRIGDEK